MAAGFVTGGPAAVRTGASVESHAMSDERATTSPSLMVAASASAGAGLIHAAAAGIHSDDTTLARVFVVLAALQFGVALLAIVQSGRAAAGALAAVNGAAAAGWFVTRLTGISWIDGLRVAERPQLADTTAAVLAGAAVVAAGAALLDPDRRLPRRAVANAAVLVGLLVVPGLLDTTSHDHGPGGQTPGGHDHGAAADATDDDHSHTATDTTGAPTGDATVGAAGQPGEAAAKHSHPTDASLPTDAAQAATTWPRPWNPDESIDFSDVPGVTPEQQARAEQLVADTLRELPTFADVAAIGALGFRSIGDASTGYEHFINVGYITDDRFLDPTAPESLVYRVDGDERTLVSAMFIADRTPIDDPELVDFGGPLMQWHVHLNLCWGLGDDGMPVVKGVTDDFGGTCPPGTVNAGGENPMVHVWITPHECGPFAALEGHGAGQVDPSAGSRIDQCAHDHAAEPAPPPSRPYDPALPIDLSGVPGVTPEQQAFAEDLVAATLRYLPQWEDLSVVEAAGFHSIGDGATGHEHYIQWDWIDDDVWLDPNFPESLVFEPQPDGTKQLVSAMYMLPSGYPLDEVPDWGGELMQWHVHGDLCFTDDPVAPQVAGIKPLGTACQPPLVDGTMAPMIHVWIVPTECGPFAALEGIAGGQVPDGEAVWCDHVHGA